MNLSEHLRHISNFPKEGVNFIDITTVLSDPLLFRETIEQMLAAVSDLDFEIIVGAESRGFIMGAPMAYAAGVGFVPVRKKGKLPAETVIVNYELEYGQDTLEMHKDAISPGAKVLIVDDLLATGGTAKANIELVEKLGGKIAGLLFFIELESLHGREKLTDYPIRSLVKI
ncbi:MAG TPA: adenine phosphoribosyltransferase [Clostridiaceae bacterium]|nr:adenine phosphoribosyltransferase [Clostridiaceae bacterium]